MIGMDMLRRGMGVSPARREPDVEEAHEMLLGARASESSPVSGTHAAAQTYEAPSSRLGATAMSGAIERLSDLGDSLSSGLTRATNAFSHWRHPHGQHKPLPRQSDSIELVDGEASAHPKGDPDSYQEMDEQLNREVDDVLANTFNYKKAGYETAKVLGRGAIAGTAMFGSYKIINGLLTSDTPSEGQSMARGMLAGGLMVPLYTEGKKLMEGVVEAVTDKATLTYAEALEITHHRRQAESAEYLKTLPDDIQRCCKKIDLFLMQALGAAKKGDKVNYSLIRGMLHWRKDFMIGRPTKTQEVAQIRDDAGRAVMLKRMHHELRRYPPILHDKLCGFTLGIAARSVQQEVTDAKRAPAGFDILELDDHEDWHRWEKVPHVPKQMMMLAGEPGTGKTHYAEKILPRLLGLTVESMILPDKHAGGVNSLMARGWLALEQDEFVTADQDAIGEIGLMLMRAKCLNPILLLDEADLDDMDGIKRLTDPSRDTLEAKALETVLDFSRVTILMGTNAFKRTSPKSGEGGPGELEPALADRMEMALFEGTDKLTKREAAIVAYHGWAGLHCLDIKGTGQALLNDEQQQDMQRLFKGSLDYLVDAHHDTAKIPGARMQVPVASVVNYLAYRLLDAQHEGTPKPTQEDVRRYIDQYYSLRMGEKWTDPEARGDRPEASSAAEQRALDREAEVANLAEFTIGGDSDSESGEHEELTAR